jgi:hypothetical protein
VASSFLPRRKIQTSASKRHAVWSIDLVDAALPRQFLGNIVEADDKKRDAQTYIQKAVTGMPNGAEARASTTTAELSATAQEDMQRR